MSRKQNYNVLHEKFNFMYALNVNHDFILRSGYRMYTLGMMIFMHVTVVIWFLVFDYTQFAYFGIV